MKEWASAIGQRFKELRVSSRQTQEEAADEMGFATQNLVTRFERGVILRMPLSMLRSVLTYVAKRGFTAEWLLSGNNPMLGATREQLAEALAELYRRDLLAGAGPAGAAPIAPVTVAPPVAPVAPSPTPQVSVVLPTGKKAEPVEESAAAWAVAETVEPGYRTVSAEELPLMWHGHYIPVIGRLAAGDSAGADTVEAESHPPGWADSFLVYDGAPPAAIAARLLGDAMAPHYQDGDMIVVDLARSVREGICCVIYPSGSGQLAKLKRLRIAGRVAFLESTNPVHPAIKLPAKSVRGHLVIDHLPRLRRASSAPPRPAVPLSPRPSRKKRARS